MKARCPHRCPWFADCYTCSPPDGRLEDSKISDKGALVEAFEKELLGCARRHVDSLLPGLPLDEREELARYCVFGGRAA